MGCLWPSTSGRVCGVNAGSFSVGIVCSWFLGDCVVLRYLGFWVFDDCWGFGSFLQVCFADSGGFPGVLAGAGGFPGVW